MGWIVGDGAMLPTSGGTALSERGVYFVDAVDADTLTLHTSRGDAQTGTGAVDLADTGNGTLQLVKLTVAERIERQIQQALIDGLSLAVKDVQRFSHEGNSVEADGSGDLPDFWIIVTAGEEDELGDDSELAAINMQTKVLPVTVDMHIRRVPAGWTAGGYGNHLVGLLTALLMNDPTRTEGGASGGGSELALDTDIAGSFAPRRPISSGICWRGSSAKSRIATFSPIRTA